MQKKSQKQVLFSNFEPTTQRGNRHRPPRPTQPKQRIRHFDFKYSFKQYLKLALAKILPTYLELVTFIPQQQRVIGE